MKIMTNIRGKTFHDEFTAKSIGIQCCKCGGILKETIGKLSCECGYEIDTDNATHPTIT